MAYIYIIKNTENSNVYIGQTIQPIKERFKQHLFAAKNKIKITKFYKAINEIGESKFYIELLEECDIDELNRKEVEYIAKYNSFYNGYNSTIGGENAHSILKEIDTDEFINDYLEGMPLIVLASKFKISLTSVLKLRDNLKMDKRGKVTGTSSGEVVVDKLDIHYNYICTYKSIIDALRDCDKTQGYCYIQKSMLGGSISYGYRWQRREYIERADGKVYNTIYDKYEHEILGKEIELDNFGRLRVIGIDYSLYVGNTVKYKCKYCGEYTNNDICDKCADKINKENNNAARLIRVEQLINEGKSLNEIGRILGISGNAVKKYCVKYNLEYSTKHKDKNIIIMDSNGVYIESTVTEFAEYLINSGITKSELNNIKNRIKMHINNGKNYLGFKMMEHNTKDINSITLDEYMYAYGINYKKDNKIIAIFPQGQRYECTIRELAEYFVNNNYTKMSVERTSAKIKQNMKSGLNLFGVTFLELD